MRIALLLLLIGVGSNSLMHAQEDSTSAAVSESDAPNRGGSSEERLSAPATLNGGIGSADLLSGNGTQNQMRGGLTVSTMFTDPVVTSASRRGSDLSFAMMPSFGLSRETSRTNLLLSAGAGFVKYKTNESLDQASEDASLSLDYRLTQWTNVRLSDSFVNTNGLFSGNNQTARDVPGLQLPNSTVITPSTSYRSNAVAAEITRQYSADGLVGVRGNFSFMRFPASDLTARPVPLHGGETYAVETFLSRRLAQKQWLGITLKAQRLETGDAGTMTESANALLSYSYSFNPRMSFAVFAGPEYSNTVGPNAQAAGRPFSRSRISSAGGMSLSAMGQRTSASLGYAHRVSDGGGLGSAVTLDSVTAAVSRQLGPRQMLRANFVYGYNRPLDGSQNLHSIAGLALVERQLGSGLSMQLGYGREYQTQYRGLSASTPSRAWVSLSYEFVRPIR